jgi:hypothetical protein
LVANFRQSGFDAGLACADIGRDNLWKKPGNLAGLFFSTRVQTAAAAIS